jgi:signal transduction histidine kinase
VNATGGHKAEPLAPDVRAAVEQVRRTAEEQAALRRVATLVARAAPPEGVFAAVTEEAGRVLNADEFAAYYTVAEALTNTAKHARASAAEVEVAAAEGVLRVRIRDDGVGGADFGRGTGLAGLKDRVESLGGQIFLDSPPGAGTSLWAELRFCG